MNAWAVVGWVAMGWSWRDYTAATCTTPKTGTMGWVDFTVPDADAARDFSNAVAVLFTPAGPAQV